VVDLVAGGAHTLVRFSDGRVLGWGDNADNLLLLGPDVKLQTVPRVIGALRGIRQMSIAQFHACAVFEDGGVRCWGGNAAGQLGNGGVRPKSEPTPVVDIQNVAEVRVSGLQTCLRTESGAVSCMGTDVHGVQSRPLALKMPPAAGLAVATESACARLADGGVFCWGVELGKFWDYGKSITGSYANLAPPVRIKELVKVGAIAMGSGHACAADEQGRVLCLGDGQSGQLGDGRSGDIYRRVKALPVPGLEPVDELAAGAAFTCARTRAKSVYCFGAGADGALGTGDAKRQAKPVHVPSLSGVTRIAAGAAHACALTEGGKVWCWGSADRGQIGTGRSGKGETQPTPVQVELTVR
jgi:alpha-tubulin suppressor-like RCC1 family protein